ncbi:MAG: hypothetical protein WBR29_01415 [Gammaproteobacteria bacterium]
MKIIFILCIYTAVLLTTGCSSSDDSDKNAAQDAPPPVTHTVFAPYIREIDKAKNVQNTVDSQKQAMDRQLQSQTGTSNAPSAASQSPP